MHIVAAVNETRFLDIDIGNLGNAGDDAFETGAVL
jgi:hypothetical protein